MLPLLALIPGLLWTGAKVVGPIIEDHSTQLASVLGGVLSNSPTGKKIVDAFESVLGPIEDQKKEQMEIEFNLLLNQDQIDIVEANSRNFFQYGPRPFLFWVLDIALAMSVLVEPTINYVLGMFHIAAPPAYQLSSTVLYILTGLCGLMYTARGVEKSIKNRSSK